jgi:ribonuclease HI
MNVNKFDLNIISVFIIKMLTFGKYRHKSVKEVVNNDTQYSKWLITQPWFTIKHKPLYHSFLHELDSKAKDTTTKLDTIDKFIIYTDGACRNNGSQKATAGIGVYFSDQNKLKLDNISERLVYQNQTNNAAELMAILKALEKCKENNIKKKIVIYTDSDYSMKCITVWYCEWVKNNKCDKRKNIDLLHKINVIYQELDIDFIHIRSHTGLTDVHSLGNQNADNLATKCLI